MLPLAGPYVFSIYYKLMHLHYLSAVFISYLLPYYPWSVSSFSTLHCIIQISFQTINTLSWNMSKES